MSIFKINIVKNNKIIGSFASNNFSMIVQAYYQRLHLFPTAIIELWQDEKKINDPQSFMNKWKNFDLH